MHCEICVFPKERGKEESEEEKKRGYRKFQSECSSEREEGEGWGGGGGRKGW